MEEKKIKLMGILNATPDSFYDGGRFCCFEEALKRGKQLAAEGADIIDIGGESTRPYSDPVSEEEELCRVIPVIEELVRSVSIPLSIDTCKYSVAAAAVAAGAAMINDVSGFRDPRMIEVAASLNVPVCCMHMLGSPKTMQVNPRYDEGIVNHLLRWGEAQAAAMIAGGIKEKHIILDPGIGFGKTVAHNLEILQNLPKLRQLGFPLLIGASRKSFLTRILGKPPEELGAATLVAHLIAMQGEADYIRVHDVVPHADAIKIIQAMKACIP